MAVGRPTKYLPEMCEQARRLCLLGATNEQLAKAFEVKLSTLEKWITEKPEFIGAIKEGREHADGQVAGALYAKAMAGDTTACIFWLKNRRSANWREKQEVEHSGHIGATKEQKDAAIAAYVRQTKKIELTGGNEK